MQIRDTLKNIAGDRPAYDYGDLLQFLCKRRPDYLTYFYITYTLDEEGEIFIDNIEIDSTSSIFEMFSVEPLHTLLVNFTIDCIKLRSNRWWDDENSAQD